MHPLLPVMAGGAIGAAARYLTVAGLGLRGGWPVGTFAVNLLGGLLMGALAALVLKGAASETARLFLGVGVLGGFTTFSAFSLEGFQMIERGQWGMALLYAGASVVGSIAALALGYAVVRA
ncbi:MAG: fluoride efflux transporter CrcB [Chakrabartia godavariana]